MPRSWYPIAVDRSRDRRNQVWRAGCDELVNEAVNSDLWRDGGDVRPVRWTGRTSGSALRDPAGRATARPGDETSAKLSVNGIYLALCSCGSCNSGGSSSSSSSRDEVVTTPLPTSSGRLILTRRRDCSPVLPFRRHAGRREGQNGWRDAVPAAKLSTANKSNTTPYKWSQVCKNSLAIIYSSENKNIVKIPGT